MILHYDFSFSFFLSLNWPSRSIQSISSNVCEAWKVVARCCAIVHIKLLMSYYSHLQNSKVKIINYNKIPYIKVMKGHWSQIFKFWLRNGLTFPVEKKVDFWVFHPAVHSGAVISGRLWLLPLLTCYRWQVTSKTWHTTPDTWWRKRKKYLCYYSHTLRD